jgi:hypothetical protein
MHPERIVTWRPSKELLRNKMTYRTILPSANFSRLELCQFCRISPIPAKSGLDISDHAFAPPGIASSIRFAAAGIVS